MAVVLLLGAALAALGCSRSSGAPMPQPAPQAPQVQAQVQVQVQVNDRWFAFTPPPETFDPKSKIDLHFLNEARAGDSGFIEARKGRFVFGKTGETVRFWGVNGPASEPVDALRVEARQLAKYGVNLVRTYAQMFDDRGRADPSKARHVLDVVAAMKAEGIYTHLTIFFPLGFKPPPDLDWLPGYDGKKPALAVLLFNHEFQRRYQEWWRTLLEARSSPTGPRLVDDPAVMGVELLNEDSLLFWTFNADAIPDPQLRNIEAQFGAWLRQRFGSLEQTLVRWKGLATKRDSPQDGRMGMRPLWDITQNRTLRDQDTIRFLVETQRRFYQDQVRFLRGLGFRGLITASNWQTASPEILGPLEEYSYGAGDFMDRHGYFACRSRGEAADWSIREGQSYIDRSALRFDPEEPGQGLSFVHPSMEIGYDDKPSMLSEVAWNRPNRYRGEAPLYLAAYGALQDTDAIVHFYKDGSDWKVKPGFFMQPWTLMSPATMGQFPAAALIYRKGLVREGDLVVDLPLGLDNLFALAGTPLPQQAPFDELRRKDLPPGTTAATGRIDPLVHYVGRTRISFREHAGASAVRSMEGLIDRQRGRVSSSTGELLLDYAHGLLLIRAPAAQGASGNLAAAGEIDLPDVTINSPMDLIHVVLASLDGRPLASSSRILLQVMTEEKASGFRATPAPDRTNHIGSIGLDPWQVRAITGSVRLKRPDAAGLRVEALDLLGRPTGRVQGARAISLESSTLYYLVTSPP